MRLPRRVILFPATLVLFPATLVLFPATLVCSRPCGSVPGHGVAAARPGSHSTADHGRIAREVHNPQVSRGEAVKRTIIIVLLSGYVLRGTWNLSGSVRNIA